MKMKMNVCKISEQKKRKERSNRKRKEQKEIKPQAWCAVLIHFSKIMCLFDTSVNFKVMLWNSLCIIYSKQMYTLDKHIKTAKILYH